MVPNSYTRTKLWKEVSTRRIADPTIDPAVSSVVQVLADAETLLESSGTSCTDFTLHDAAHAFRVAENMASIIPDLTWRQLSLEELCLLLLAAYLHDIGMVPKQSTAQAVHDFVLTRDETLLATNEQEKLIAWLDESDVSVLSEDDLHSVRVLRKAREIAAGYCRHRHNDWSENWIRSNTNLGRLYPQFVDDLVTVCRSHHEGYSRLLSSAFEPVRLPTNGQVLHRRYVACVLRIADVMDVDPERTPPVIFQHRTIAEPSEIFWKKDQLISVTLANDTLHLSAEPTTAVLHKAIEVTADGIEQELRLCHQISTEMPFSTDKSVPDVNLPHQWRLRPYLHSRIVPRNNCYEYINGSFRPNSEKVLQLLGSQELYAKPFTAIRELLQNAFDSVRERIAYTCLQQIDLGVEDTNIANRFCVTLDIESEGDDVILTCTDEGAGMSKKILRDNFLVSGNSQRSDLRTLARRCQENGVIFSRTGQFGIGVLSYFLLANRVEVYTRRAPECGDEDSFSWSFITEGVGTFGELKKADSALAGTTVRMRLRPEVASSVDEFTSNVREFVEDTIVRSPCRFHLFLGGKEILSTSPGWTRDRVKLTNHGFLWMDREAESSSPVGLPAHFSALELERHSKKMRALHDLAQTQVEWHTSDDIDLADLGVCRIHIPVHKVNGHPAPFLMVSEKTEAGYVILVLDQRHNLTIGMNVADITTLSWKGMAIRARVTADMRFDVWEILSNWQDALVELDISSAKAGRLSLNREFLDVDDREDIHKIEKALAPHIRNFKHHIRERMASSQYGALWFSAYDPSKIPETVPRCWSQSPGSGSLGTADYINWSPVVFPAIDQLDWLPRNKLMFQDKEVTELYVLSREEAGAWRPLTFPWTPTGVALLQKNGIQVAIIPVWLEADDTQHFVDHTTNYRFKRVCTFPKSWENIIGVRPHVGAPIWNRGFIAASAGSKTAQEWLNEQAGDKHWASVDNAIEIVRSAIGRSDCEAEVFLECIQTPARWLWLTQKAPDLAEALWGRWSGGARELRYITHHIKDDCLSVEHKRFRQDGVFITETLEGIPDPGKDWTVFAHE